MGTFWLGVRNPAAYTNVYIDRERWLVAARRRAQHFGNPVATLNTRHVERFLFSDGTSMDLLVEPFPADAPYVPRRLHQNVLGFFSSSTAAAQAATYVKKWERAGYPAESIWSCDQPDPAFAKGRIIIVLTSADYESTGELFRFASLRMGKPRPMAFTGWPS